MILHDRMRKYRDMYLSCSQKAADLKEKNSHLVLCGICMAFKLWERDEPYLKINVIQVDTKSLVIKSVSGKSRATCYELLFPCFFSIMLHVNCALIPPKVLSVCIKGMGRK